MSDDDVLAFDTLADPEQWVRGSRRSDCSICRTKFTMFKRKQHCRVCGDIMCSTCFVKRRAEIPMVGVIDIKVCADCANGIARNSRRPRAGHRSSSESLSSGAQARDHGFIARTSSAPLVVSCDGTNRDEDQRVTEWARTYNSSLFSEASLHASTCDDSSDLSTSFMEEPDLLEDCESEIGSVDAVIPPEGRTTRALTVALDELEDIRHLANGSHCAVWLVRHCEYGLLVSKRLLHDRKTSESVERFIDRLELASHVKHPRIVTLVGLVPWTTTKRLQALFEYLPHGDLRTFLDATARDVKGRATHNRRKLIMALDVAEALVHLHAFNPPIVHGALQSRKVLLTAQSHAKLSHGMAPVSPMMTSCSQSLQFCRRWLAPEILKGSTRKLNVMSDIFPLGVLLCELDTHAIPYSDCLTPQGEPLPEPEIELMIALGELQPTISHECPAELRKLAVDCLALEPTQRPTAVEVAVRLRTCLRAYGLEAKREQEQGATLCDPAGTFS